MEGKGTSKFQIVLVQNIERKKRYNGHYEVQDANEYEDSKILSLIDALVILGHYVW